MPSDGSDIAQDDLIAFQDINEVKNSYAASAAPGSPATGVLHWDTDDDELRVYEGGWADVGSKYGAVVEGAVVPWIGGYYTGANNGYTYVLGSADSVTGANSYLNSLGWYVCDGAALNDAGSTIFNGASRYLPQLTDDRFIMGATTLGTAETGGSNTDSHTHDVDQDSVTSSQSGAGNNAEQNTPDTSAALDHNHEFDPALLVTSGPSLTENRPAYLAVFYIMYIEAI